MALEIIILAAGKGKRMHSALPKVLHKLAGKPLLQYVIETSAALSPKAIHIVAGHKAEVVQAFIDSLDESLKKIISVSIQKEQLGTGHAVATALPKVDSGSDVLVLYGDTPLTPVEVLQDLVKEKSTSDMAVLSAIADNPFGYGRIIRNSDGSLNSIVEEKDASAEQKLIKEVNTGMIVSSSSLLNEYLPKIKNSNAQGEYYLTDLAGMLASSGHTVSLKIAPDFNILAGVNSKPQLASLERLLQLNNARKLMESGVTLADPSRFDLRGSLECGEDCFIDINCVFEGSVKLGSNVTIGAGCVLKNCTIADNSEISPYSVIEQSSLGRHNTIGPFARLRPGNVLEDEVHIGNFVEVKKSLVKLGTKAGHLSYLGDAEIGKNVNIGAGTITCNYDGANKHKTLIGDDVFVGSDTQLVAPVSVANGVTIGAGSTVTRKIKAPENALIVTRPTPKVFENFPRPTKKH